MIDLDNPSLDRELADSMYALNRAITEAKVPSDTVFLTDLRDRLWDFRRHINPNLKD